MRIIVLALILPFLGACGTLTPAKFEQYLETGQRVLGQVQATVDAVAPSVKVVAEASGASQKTLDKIDAGITKLHEVSGLANTTAQQLRDELAKVPTKPDGTPDWQKWLLGGGATTGLAALVQLYLRAKAGDVSHAQNVDRIGNLEDSLTAIRAAIAHTVPAAKVT